MQRFSHADRLAAAQYTAEAADGLQDLVTSALEKKNAFVRIYRAASESAIQNLS